MPATVSVVLPNYIHAKLIGRALRALLTQKRAAGEIIVIDDGSTDDNRMFVPPKHFEYFDLRVSTAGMPDCWAEEITKRLRPVFDPKVHGAFRMMAHEYQWPLWSLKVAPFHNWVGSCR